MTVLKYLVMYLLMLLVCITIAVGGWSPLSVPAFVFVAIPLLDQVIGADTSEPAGRTWVHDAVVRLWAPLQLVVVAAALATVPHRPAWESVLLLAGVGVMTGAGGITIAHELVHRTTRGDRALAEILMTTVSYPWWLVEHVLGHHRWVGTPRDPATARLGESVYAFLPRSIFGGLASFWSLERAYAARRGIPWWSLRDRRTRYALELVALWAGLAAVGGWAVVGAFAVQAVVGVVLLEVINYIEHYGLVRTEVRPGEYERVKPQHSWNSNHWLTGAFLFNLPRHADHHAHAARPYWDLRPFPDAPELPLGYAGMVLVAMVPPLYRRWMEPRVAAMRA
ncbi:MAG: alkane 1-monooxygenase [Myxococcota bacterium]